MCRLDNEIVGQIIFDSVALTGKSLKQFRVESPVTSCVKSELSDH